MQLVKMPDGTILIHLHNATEFNVLGCILMTPECLPPAFSSEERDFALKLSRQLASVMQKDF